MEQYWNRREKQERELQKNEIAHNRDKTTGKTILMDNEARC